MAENLPYLLLVLPNANFYYSVCIISTFAKTISIYKKYISKITYNSMVLFSHLTQAKDLFAAKHFFLLASKLELTGPRNFFTEINEHLRKHWFIKKWRCMALLCGSLPVIWKNTCTCMYKFWFYQICEGARHLLKCWRKALIPLTTYICVCICVPITYFTGILIIHVESFFKMPFVSLRFLCLSLNDTQDDWKVEVERLVVCNFICFIEQNTWN